MAGNRLTEMTRKKKNSHKKTACTSTVDKSVATLSGLVIPAKINLLIYRRVTTVVSEKDSNRNMAISENPSRQSNIKKSLCYCVQTAWWSYLPGTLVQLIVR